MSLATDNRCSSPGRTLASTADLRGAEEEMSSCFLPFNNLLVAGGLSECLVIKDQSAEQHQKLPGPCTGRKADKLLMIILLMIKCLVLDS